MKIQLIFPPMDKTYGGNNLAVWRSPPGGLAQLAKAAEFSGVPREDIEILDGNFLSLNEIIRRIEPGLTGITTWYNNAHNTRTIAKEVKRMGGFPVLGGNDVNRVTAERIIVNNSFVDRAVIGRGVSVMPFLIEEAERYFRTEENTRRVLRGIDFSQLWEESMLFDFEHLDWIKYPTYTTQIAVDGIRGCDKAKKKGPCVYCSTGKEELERGVRRVWEQVGLINSMYGFDYFFETGDTIMRGDYLERLVEARPKQLENIRWRIYSGAGEITPESVELFRRLNVAQLFIGIESHDDKVLRKNNRSNTVEDNLRAVESAIGGPWEMHLTVMYGLRGETEESMKKGYDFLARARERHGERTFILAGPALPLAGSADFSWLAGNSFVQSRYQGDLQKEDIFDYEALTRIKFDLMTDTNYDRVMQYVQKTMALVGKERGPGFGVNK
jgi:radical SAM superfamily enzyme YgiQ (UPF0313 family)